MTAVTPDSHHRDIRRCGTHCYTTLIAVGLGLSVGCGAAGTAMDAGGDPSMDAPIDGYDDLQPFLATIRANHATPSIAALVMEGGVIKALGVDGVRKTGDDTRAETTDRYHLGSCTKAMTATLVAKLVEEDLIAWDTTLSELFPDVAAMTTEYSGVTISQLLHHRSGVTGNLPQDHPSIWGELWTSTKPVSEQRAWFAEDILTKPVSGTVGSFVYSNAGYMLIGAAIEELSGKSWEELMTEKLFTPLAMTDCAFGAPATPNMVDQPWGHSGDSAVPPGPSADNPAALGPAGTVNCSIESWAKFVSVHLAGAQGMSGYVAASSFAILHTPDSDSSYAAGWGVVEREWSGGRVLTHDGSNTMFYATVVVAPEKNHAFLVITNRGDQPAQASVTETVEGLIEKYVNSN